MLGSPVLDDRPDRRLPDRLTVGGGCGPDLTGDMVGRATATVDSRTGTEGAFGGDGVLLLIGVWLSFEGVVLKESTSSTETGGVSVESDATLFGRNARGPRALRGFGRVGIMRRDGPGIVAAITA